MRASNREVRLVEVVAGRRRKRARRTAATGSSGRASQARTSIEAVSESKRAAGIRRGRGAAVAGNKAVR